MKKQKFLDNKDDILQWLNKYNINNFTINDNLVVDVNEHVMIDGEKLLKKMHFTCLPVQFGQINGDFVLKNIGLKSLVGCPQVVWGDFNASYNKLKSVDYLPSFIEKKLLLNHNQLTEIDLRKLNINQLYLQVNAIDSLTKIYNYGHIDSLLIGQNPLNDLVGCPPVKKLSLTHIHMYTEVGGLSLKGINYDIEALDLWDVNIEDEKELQYCQQLTQLILAKNVNTLEFLPLSIEELDVSGRIEKFKVFELLNYSKLKKLCIDQRAYDGLYLTSYLEKLKLEHIKFEHDTLSTATDFNQKSSINKIKI